MSHIFVYRNCFTGDISGGDMHTGGVSDWIDTHHSEHPLYLVHAKNDGQEKAYRETNIMRQITYTDTAVKKPALMYLLRAIKGNRVPLPLHRTGNVFIAGSHFLPDVWPVLGQGRKAPGTVRAVYIHHIVQDMPRPKSINTLLANAQEQFCLNLIKYDFDKIIAVNQEVIDSLRGRGFTQPILLSSNFVNTHNTRVRPYAKKDITLAFCGRLVNQKGVDDFLHVCEVLQIRIPGFRAVMIGEGPEKERLQKIIDKKQLHVELAGFVAEDRKFELVSRAKLFVLPSVEEGWGIVIAESLSVGTPVLAYWLPAYKQPFSGVLQSVPLSHSKQLAQKAGDLLVSYDRNPAAYGDTQKVLTDRAKMFSRDSVAAKEFDFLMEGVHA